MNVLFMIDENCHVSGFLTPSSAGGNREKLMLGSGSRHILLILGGFVAFGLSLPPPPPSFLVFLAFAASAWAVDG
jgi:hypothetical protein